jgi:nucleotide-binding universal stress UspA family protein
MTWKPIVAGVDDSPEGLRAAQAAVAVAEKARVPCYLCHAIRGWFDPNFPQMPEAEEWRRLLIDSARTNVLQRLSDNIPQATLDLLDVRFGPASVILAQRADEVDAQLIVIGGKHHSALGRWLAGSTAHELVRSHDRPLLVVGPARPGEQFPVSYRRVLAAVDLSDAARPTIDGAERFARLYQARFRALHVVEPLPAMPEIPIGLDSDYLRRSEEQAERAIWPQITYPGTERLIRRGHAADVIAQAAADWDADLLVVASHGRGWIDRILIGSVTEQLLKQLPTSVLVMSAATQPAQRAAPGPIPVARNLELSTGRRPVGKRL